jgi:hypothetical protein
MNHAGRHHVAGSCALLGATLMAFGAAALLGGCKNNTSAAATIERHAAKPPVVTAHFASNPLTAADPFASSLWQAASWLDLVAPANTPRTTPPGKTAILFDHTTLYVAVICDLPLTADADGRDAVSLYLDTRGEGRELLQVTADSTGRTQCTWIRSGSAAAPLEDGSPNLGFPLDVRPDYQLAGLNAQVRQGTYEGRPVWMLALAIPVAGMPALMQTPPTPDAHWKFNIVRTCITGTGEHRAILQSNLSPVHVNAQAVSPYRMAELDFSP